MAKPIQCSIPCWPAHENHAARIATAIAAPTLTNAASVANKLLESDWWGGSLLETDLAGLLNTRRQAKRNCGSPVRPSAAMAKTANRKNNQKEASDGVSATKTARTIASISGGNKIRSK